MDDMHISHLAAIIMAYLTPLGEMRSIPLSRIANLKIPLAFEHGGAPVPHLEYPVLVEHKGIRILHFNIIHSLPFHC